MSARPPFQPRRPGRTAPPARRPRQDPAWLGTGLGMILPLLAAGSATPAPAPETPPSASPAPAAVPAPQGTAESPRETGTDDAGLSEMNFDQLINLKIGTVFGASKHWQETAEAPGVVSILTAEEIKLFGHRTLGEALRSVAGLYVTYDRNYTTLGIGGFNRGDLNSHVLVMVDGHRLNDSLQDAVPLGHDFDLDVDLIDRIEIIQGPGATVYGNNAFFGVIHVITRNGRDFQGSEAAASYGSGPAGKGRFSHGRKLESGLEFLLSGSYRDSAGNDRLYYPEFDSPSSNNGVAREVDDEQSYNLYGSLRWRALSLSGSLVDRQKTVPTASYSTVFNSPRNRTQDTRGAISLGFDQSFPGDWEITARLTYDHSAFDGYYLYDEAPTPPPQLVLNLDRFRGDRVTAEAQVSRLLLERHTLSAGAEIRSHLREEMVNLNEPPRETILDVSQNSWAAGVYGNAILALPLHLQLHAGVRYDHFDTFGGTINPRLALVHTPARSTVLKLIGGTAYRAPNSYERLYSDGGFSTEPNPRLDPETITTVQGVWSQELPAQVRLETSGFFYQVEDLISQGVNGNTGLLRYENTETVEAAGGQVRIAKNWSGGVRAAVSYTFQDVRDTALDRRLSGSPRHLAKGSLVIPVLAERIFAALELQYYGESLTLTRRHADDYWLANLNLYTQKLVPNLEVSAGVYNLFDADYSVPGKAEHTQDLLPQDGISFRLKLTYRF